MENASKALIIAGAILLSILIISLGIMVYNNAKSTVSDANLSSEQAQTYNSKFTMYTGDDIPAANVNSLVAAVNANNATNDNKITITVGSLTNTPVGTTAKDDNNQYNFTVQATQKYQVSYTLGATGLVSKITIKNAGTTSTGD